MQVESVIWLPILNFFALTAIWAALKTRVIELAEDHNLIPMRAAKCKYFQTWHLLNVWLVSSHDPCTLSQLGSLPQEHSDHRHIAIANHSVQRSHPPGIWCLHVSSMIQEYLHHVRTVLIDGNVQWSPATAVTAVDLGSSLQQHCSTGHIIVDDP